MSKHDSIHDPARRRGWCWRPRPRGRRPSRRRSSTLAPPGAADRRRPQPGPERREGRGRRSPSSSATSTRSAPRTCSSGRPSTPSRTATTSARPTGTSSSAAATGCSWWATCCCGTSRRRPGSSPARAGRRLDRETLLARLRSHIATVVGRYRGRIGGWDVVNEALEEDGTLRRTPWLEAIGEDYVAKAFEFAHEADPAAELYYNDYNLWKPAKRDAAIRLVQGLKAKGLRVDGIGEQGHWGLDDPPLAAIDEALAAIRASGTRRR